MAILCPGTCSELSADNINILRSAGIRTVVDFLTHSPDQIAIKCSFSHKIVLAIRKALLAQHASLVVSGSNIYQRVSQKLTVLHTGIQSIDNLLAGGLLSTELTELTGASATGKTQICLAVAARASLIPKHCVLYISTGADFSSERLREFMIFSGSQQKNLSEALDQVKCIHAFDVFRLLEVLHNLPLLIHDDSVFYAHLKLVIVDSIAAVIAPIIGGKQIEGHGLMMQVARKLKEIVVEENIAVLVTNRVVQSDRNLRKPALGASWLHIPHTRVLLTNQREDGTDHSILIRKATIIKSIRQPINLTTRFVLPGN